MRKIRSYHLLLGLFVALVPLTVTTVGADSVIATDGTTQYTIIVDPEASVSEKHAAAELADFLNQVTGAEFPVTEATAVGEGPALVVGPGAAARALAPDLRYDDLYPDGIIIHSVGDHIIFAGDQPRGTLYAVYTFLEDTVGCRWWSSTASTIPHKPTLVVPQQQVRYIPPLEYREPFWWDAFDGDWAARNKSNGLRPRLEEKHGGKNDYVGWFVHTFDLLIPPKEYFATNPEYFSERNGERIGADGARTQLCVTNQEVKDLIVEKVFEWIEKHPDGKIISVSQNDWDHHCLCEECLKLEEEEGSPAGPLLHLVNYVAERVAQRYPHIAVDTLAYQYTRKPPLHVKPLPNVIIRLCSIECSFLQPLDHPANQTFADDIRGWEEICDRIYIWDYVTTFSHYISPFPNQRVLAPNIRFFVEHGVKGVFAQGAYQSPGAEMAELKAWVLAKLMWNPYLDDEALIEEFILGYFGDAGPAILEYNTLLHDTAEATEYYMGCWATPNAPYFTLDFLNRAEELFNAAEEAVAGDEEMLNRVQVARMPLRYIWAYRWHDMRLHARVRGIPWQGPENMLANAQEFMRVAEKNNITRIAEARTIDVFKERTVDLGRIESPPPPGCEDLAWDRYIDFQDSSFRLYREGTWSRLVADEKASDKVAAWMPSTHHEWAVQQEIVLGDFPEDTNYTIYASIRHEKKGDEGNSFSFGLYDVKNRLFMTSTHVKTADIPDNEYHTYEVYSGPLHEEMYIWVAPVNNPDNVDGVWVDRIWLVRED